MTQINEILKFGAFFACMAFFISCGDNDDTVIPPPEPGVETLSLTFNGTGIGLDAVTIDSKKNIYVSNFGMFTPDGGTGSEVFKISPYGQKTVFTEGLAVPTGNTVDKENNVYVRDSTKTIYKITPRGERSVYATSDIGFSGLIADEDGVIYAGVYAPTGSVIQKIATDGTVSILADDSGLIGTVGMAYHQPSKNLYAANFNTGNIYKVSMDGTVELLAGINSLIGYITEMNGALYATAFVKNQIIKITLDGEVEVIAGTGQQSQLDGPLLEATFNNPNGIIGDAENNVLYVSDFSSPRISKIQL